LLESLAVELRVMVCVGAEVAEAQGDAELLCKGEALATEAVALGVGCMD